jgi:hypothetical protein
MDCSAKFTLFIKIIIITFKKKPVGKSITDMIYDE